MNDFLLIPIAILYLIIVALLFVYGINFFYLTFISLRSKTRKSPLPPEQWPHVTVQLPIYNERYVARRLIEAAAGLDYPHDRLEIQVLDDSTDDTIDIVRETVEKYRAKGLDIRHIHRTNRSGYKAGALAAGLAAARGDFLAIFDADFVPGKDFLRRTVPEFQDAGIAFVQTRWTHLNRDYSLLTLLQSIAIDAHFMVEQYARFNSGFWFNFNGTAGIWRKAAITDSGGWRSRTLTEDLDLSYRSFLHGWRGVYRRDVEVPAELPVTMSGYRRQQRRWAQGSLECAVALIPAIARRPIAFSRKLEAGLHLTGYGIHLLLFMLALVYPAIVTLTARYPDLVPLFGIAALFNITAFAPTVFFVSAQSQLGKRWWTRIPSILFISVLGTGMMINTAKAAWNILVNGQTAFERTPKFGIAARGQRWQLKQYQIKTDPIVYLEFAFALYNLNTAVTALQQGNWVIAIYAGLFAAGLVFAASLSVTQTLSLRRSALTPVPEA